MSPPPSLTVVDINIIDIINFRFRLQVFYNLGMLVRFERAIKRLPRPYTMGVTLNAEQLGPGSWV